MSKTAAVKFQVRWRKNDEPDTLWSSPVDVGKDGHVNVPGLERVNDYVFQARAGSACGAWSDWVVQTFNTPDVDPGTLTLTDINNTANSNTVLVQNPFFSTGDLTGWTSDHGTYAYEQGTNGPMPGTSGYAKRVGNATNPTDPLRNKGRIPVVQGSVVKVAANIRGIGANGTAGVRISWRKSDDSEISVTANDSTLTGTFNYGATVIGAAPANASFAIAEGSVKSHTTGTYTFDNFMASGGVDNLDQLPDGSTYGKIKAGNLTGGNLDLASTVITNKTLDYIPDGTIRIGGVQYTDAETVDNANFEASSATPVPGWISAASAGMSYTTAAQAYAGSRSLQVYCAGTRSGAISTRRYKCTPADVYLLRAALSGSSLGQWYGCALFYSGTTPASLKVFFSVGVGATTWAQYSGQLQVPAGVDNFALGFIANVNGAVCFVDDIALGKVRTQNGISPITWAGVRSVLSGSPISYSISGTTVTFSVAAFTNYGGGNNPAYSATSGAVTQTAGTTVTYYLYYRDPVSAGGAQTLHITTSVQDLAAFPDIVNIGSVSVTVNAGGGGTGGTGGGGGGLCVADDMWIRAGLRAGDADIGDLFDCIDLPTSAGKHKRALQGVTRGTEECVRMITSDGCVLECSVSTPFDLPDGRNVTAVHMLGEQAVTDLGVAIVTSLALIGPRPVTRAHLGGVSYAAGADPQRRIYSHNAAGSPSKP